MLHVSIYVLSVEISKCEVTVLLQRACKQRADPYHMRFNPTVCLSLIEVTNRETSLKVKTYNEIRTSFFPPF